MVMNKHWTGIKAYTDYVPAFDGPILNLDFTKGFLDGRITYSRASIGTYINSVGLVTTALSGVPRFGYDPTTLVALGLLIEEARTNLILQSADISNAAWSTGISGSGTVSRTGNSVVAPDGTTTATKVTINRSSSADLAKVIQAFTGTAAVYAGGFYVKADTAGDIGKTIAIMFYDSTTIVGAVSVTLTSSWQRVSTTGTLKASAACELDIGYSGTNGTSSTGSVSFDVWGGQAELTTTNCPLLTSYIPTTTTTVARSADVVSITGSNFSSWYTQGVGTFITRLTPPNINQSSEAYFIFDGTTNNYMRLCRRDVGGTLLGKRWQTVVAAGTVTQVNIIESADDAAGTVTLAYAFNTNDFAFYGNGASIGTDISGTVPTVDRMNIGSQNSGIEQFNGHIAFIKYFNQRLPTAALVTMTS